MAEDIPLLKTDPKKVRGQHYDIVVNGVELGGGSIRIHQPDVQKTIFEEILQIPPEMVKARFGYMLEAFRYGAPPHGGIALGFDRLIAILCGTPSIRDVIAFPKTAKGTDLMTDSPAPVEPKQLRDLYLELKAPRRKHNTITRSVSDFASAPYFFRLAMRHDANHDASSSDAITIRM